MSATATQPLFNPGRGLLGDAQITDRSPSGSGNLTLGERMSDVWEGLLRTGTADGPVCRGRMERAGQSGHCLRCGTVLS
jgi:hypothetical protein